MKKFASSTWWNYSKNCFEHHLECSNTVIISPSIEGKKYLVFPSETHEMIMACQSSAIERTEKTKLFKSDQEMKGVWDKELRFDQAVYSNIQRN